MAYAPTQNPVMIKSSPLMDRHKIRSPVVHRHRKTVSTGGGRAWSDAEEAYLIETREHKMPYKHIAAQLKKTELACRLHYHQLSFGSKARRQITVSPYRPMERASAPPPEKRRHETPMSKRRLPSFSPPPSPPQAMEYSPTGPSKTPNNHKPILPKPTPSGHRRGHETQPLRLVTEDMENYQDRQSVDMARLDRIYEVHRLHFWSTVARNYGCTLSPATLEEAWCRAHGINGAKFPPTPRGSPQSTYAPSVLNSAAPYSAVTESSKSFTPINKTEGSTPKPRVTGNNSFSVSSLLTEDKEVRRSPSGEKRLLEMEIAGWKAETSHE